MWNTELEQKLKEAKQGRKKAEMKLAPWEISKAEKIARYEELETKRSKGVQVRERAKETKQLEILEEKSNFKEHDREKAEKPKHLEIVVEKYNDQVQGRGAGKIKGKNRKAITDNGESNKLNPI